MDCKTCANYEPIEIEKPTDHPGRIFAEDLRVGMVIRGHGTDCKQELVVILGEAGTYSVPALCLFTGKEPFEYPMPLAVNGLKPYGIHGSWEASAWCEEVT